MDEAFREKAATFMGKMHNNICPICNEPMTQDVQGGTVYAQPCGHLLYFFQRTKLALEDGPKPMEQGECEACGGPCRWEYADRYSEVPDEQ